MGSMEIVEEESKGKEFVSTGDIEPNASCEKSIKLDITGTQ
jgi:hypothetical protein